MVKTSERRRLEVFVRDGWRCQACGMKVDREAQAPHPLRVATVDHIIPRACGGTNDLHNLRTLCLGCHRWLNEQDVIMSRRGKRSALRRPAHG